MSPAAAFRLQLYRRRAREFVAAKCNAASNLAALRPSVWHLHRMVQLQGLYRQRGLAHL